MSVATALTTEQGVLAGLLAARPAPIARLVAGPGRPVPTWIVRLLAARMSAQALATALAPRVGVDRPTVLRAGAAVDATHAASMVVVAARWPRYRRSAVVSGVLASLSAVANLLAARRGTVGGGRGPAGGRSL